MATDRKAAPEQTDIDAWLDAQPKPTQPPAEESEPQQTDDAPSRTKSAEAEIARLSEELEVLRSRGDGPQIATKLRQLDDARFEVFRQEEAARQRNAEHAAIEQREATAVIPGLTIGEAGHIFSETPVALQQRVSEVVSDIGPVIRIERSGNQRQLQADTLYSYRSDQRELSPEPPRGWRANVPDDGPLDAWVESLLEQHPLGQPPVALVIIGPDALAPLGTDDTAEWVLEHAPKGYLADLAKRTNTAIGIAHGGTDLIAVGDGNPPTLQAEAFQRGGETE
jgi:hypothetical protein